MTFIQGNDSDSQHAHRRFRKRVHKYIHCHTVLIAICCLSVLDSALVVGELVLDMFMLKDEYALMEERSNIVSEFLHVLLPNEFPNSSYTLQGLSQVVQHLPAGITCAGQTATHGSSPTASPIALSTAQQEGTKETGIPPLLKLFTSSAVTSTVGLIQSNISVETDYSATVNTSDDWRHHLVRRSSGSGSGHSSHSQHLMQHIGHALHYGSISILSIMVVVVVLRVYALQRHFFRRKLEVWDAIVVIVAFSLDLFLLDAIQQYIRLDGAYLLIIVLPWRVIRVINSFVMTVKEKDKIRMKFLMTSRKKAARRVSILLKKNEKHKKETKALRTLCKRHGIKDRKIDECLSSTELRKRSFPLAILTSIASLTMIGSFGTTPPTDDVSDDDFSDDDLEGTVDHEQQEAKYHHVSQTGTDISTICDSQVSINLDETTDSGCSSASLNRRRSTSLDSLESGLTIDDVTLPAASVSSAPLSFNLEDCETSSDVFYMYDETEDFCSTKM